MKKQLLLSPLFVIPLTLVSTITIHAAAEANPNAALEAALQSTNHHLVKTALDNKADINAPFSSGRSPLHVAVECSDCTRKIGNKNLISCKKTCNFLNAYI